MSFERSAAVCLDCSRNIGRAAVQAFGSTPDRDRWLHSHAANCPSHTVHTMPTWPSAQWAHDLVFGKDER